MNQAFPESPRDARSEQKSGRATTASIAILVVVLLAGGVILSLSSRRKSTDSREAAAHSGTPEVKQSPPVRRSAPLEATPEEQERIRKQVATFCGDCHAAPSPSSFPKAAWFEEVQRGFEFYAVSGRQDLEVPKFQSAVKYFQRDAPDEITLDTNGTVTSSSPVSFRATHSALGTGRDRRFVSALFWGPGARGALPELVVSDMLTNSLEITRPNRESIELRTIATLLSPAHAVSVDLDADGNLDLVVAELGRYLPSDHSDGRITWLRRIADDQFEPIILHSGLGRVADVEPIDYDGDGDLDLIVAEFGWHSTGSISILENRGSPGGRPEFEIHVIDRRSGTIHVPVADLNGDGRPDFVAVISQEHEVIEIFFNEGEGNFNRHRVFDAGDPSFGSSGIQLIDFDRDGDLALIHTNGDTFDSFYLKPNHGIRWLENLGDGTFARHELTSMPGVHRALAGDLDGDGDLDIAASALFPRVLKGKAPPAGFDSVLWLEQVEGRQFIRHSIEQENCTHAALELGDFDSDGRLDIAVGGFGEVGKQPALTIWWNEGTTRTVDTQND